MQISGNLQTGLHLLHGPNAEVFLIGSSGGILGLWQVLYREEQYQQGSLVEQGESVSEAQLQDVYKIRCEDSAAQQHN